VPGGGAATVAAMQDQALVGYVRSAAATAELVGATGNGALLLAAGLLEGRRAAVHWAYAELLESLGVTVVRERWVEDGRFLTAAGGSAGIDWPHISPLPRAMRGAIGAAAPVIAARPKRLTRTGR
jgi:transcriptional regulator GlxA family with amidase domain